MVFKYETFISQSMTVTFEAVKKKKKKKKRKGQSRFCLLF